MIQAASFHSGVPAKRASICCHSLPSCSASTCGSAAFLMILPRSACAASISSAERPSFGSGTGADSKLAPNPSSPTNTAHESRLNIRLWFPLGYFWPMVKLGVFSCPLVRTTLQKLPESIVVITLPNVTFLRVVRAGALPSMVQVIVFSAPPGCSDGM